MKTMNKNKWIAVAVGVLVVAFFLFGGTAMDFFRGTQDVSLSQPQDQSQNIENVGFRAEDIIVGTGAQTVNGALLTVHYTGMLLNGQVFDSSLQRNEPFQFVLGAGQVIPGWERGFSGMKVGGKRIIVIPPDLGYGANQVGPIPPNSTLVFEIELLNVELPQ